MIFYSTAAAATLLLNDTAEGVWFQLLYLLVCQVAYVTRILFMNAERKENLTELHTHKGSSSQNRDIERHTLERRNLVAVRVGSKEYKLVQLPALILFYPIQRTLLRRYCTFQKEYIHIGWRQRQLRLWSAVGPFDAWWNNECDVLLLNFYWRGKFIELKYRIFRGLENRVLLLFIKSVKRKSNIKLKQALPTSSPLTRQPSFSPVAHAKR